MENRVKDINDLIEHLIKKGEGTKEFETFIAILRGIKYNSSLLDFYNREFVENVIKTSSETFDKYDKALLIETIVETFYEDYSVVDEKCREEFLDEYLILLEQYATSLDNAVRCLNGFVYSGIDINKIFITISNYKDKNNAVTILSKLDIYQWTDIPCELVEIWSEVESAYKILRRSKIISQFLVIVHPLISKYTSNSFFSYEFDYYGAYMDWPYSELGSTSRLVDSKIIDIEEGAVFEKLGRLICENIEGCNSNEINELYRDFFKNRDPFDVIFTLPK